MLDLANAYPINLLVELLIGLLAVTSVAQLALLVFQALATRKAADAAKMSASLTERMIVEFETPFLFPVILSTSIREMLQKLDGENGSEASVVPAVQFTIKNFGRTPALLQKTTAVLFLGDLDEGKNDPRSDRAAELMLEPYGSLKRPFEREFLQPVSKSDVALLKVGPARIYLRGRVTFMDVFANRFEQTFCFTWDLDANAFMPWGPHRNRRKRLVSRRKKLG